MKKYKQVKEETKKLATSPTLEGIKKLIGQYFYSPNIVLTPISDNEWSVANLKGILNYKVILKNKRYIFQEK